MKKNKKKVLPDKPSELLILAMQDLEWVEGNKDYIIDMDNWHRPVDWVGGKVCEVCLAGSVMARTLEIPAQARTDPSDFSDGLQNKLLAINGFRTGTMRDGLRFFYRDYDAIPDSLCNLFSIDDQTALDYSSSANDRTEWKNCMYDLIGILQAEGL